MSASIEKDIETLKAIGYAVMTGYKTREELTILMTHPFFNKELVYFKLWYSNPNTTGPKICISNFNRSGARLVVRKIRKLYEMGLTPKHMQLACGLKYPRSRM